MIWGEGGKKGRPGESLRAAPDCLKGDNERRIEHYFKVRVYQGSASQGKLIHTEERSLALLV